MPIVNRTAELKDTNVDWTRRGQAFAQQFPNQITSGVYALLTSNPSSRPVFDRNGNGKVIVPARGHALKSGKFQRGFHQRMLTNYDHFHRRTPNEVGLFPRLLQWVLVFETDPIAGTPRRETLWNREVRCYLRQRNLDDPLQSARSESRFIPGPNSPTVAELHTLLARVIAQQGW